MIAPRRAASRPACNRALDDTRRALARRPASAPAPSTASGRSRRATGVEAAAAGDAELDDFLHLLLMNRGVLMTPFHNMALMCPATTESDVDRHDEAFAEALDALLGG